MKPASEATKELLELADRKIQYSEKTLHEFQADLQKNPLRAFVWGAGAVEAAARINAWSQVKVAAANGLDVAKIAKELRDTAFRMVRYGSDFKSTSPMSNTAKLAEASAYAETAETLEDWRLS